MTLDSHISEITYDGIPRRRILAFDGGGVRGLSSLIILRDMMRRLGRRTDRPVRPCECFELIVGTGTGAISALFLGRLGMTVDEAIVEYIGIANKSFRSSSSWQPPFLRPAVLDGGILKGEIGKVVARFVASGNCDEMLYGDPGVPHCHTAVLAATASDSSSPPWVFRSYQTRTQFASSYSICDVAHASSATTGIFSPVQLGYPPVTFVDAGDAGYNNPTEIALAEAAEIWPDWPVECVVSLGTGRQDIVSLHPEWSEVVKACRKILQNCEAVDDHMVHKGRSENFHYFRFSVDRGLRAVDIMEWRDSAGELTAITEGYTRWARIKEELDRCVHVLNGDILEFPFFTDRIPNPRAILPAAPPMLYGRDAYLDHAVYVMLAVDAGYLALLGSAGIGKTTIAMKILHESKIAQKFGHQRCFISCETIRSVSHLICSISSSFGISYRRSDPRVVDRRAEFLGFLHQKYTSHPALVVLDSFEMLWDTKGMQEEVDNFLRDLGNVKMLSLILTMRGTELPWGLQWSSPRLSPVGPLDLHAACAAFKKICNQCDTESHDLEELLREIDCVPLAVVLMARLAEHEKLAVLLKRWRKERVNLLSRPRHEDRMTNVGISIRVSLESHRMQSTPDALLLLSVLSVLPSGILEDDLARIWPRMERIREASLTLREVALVYQDDVGYLRVLSPIRLYILDNYPPNSNYLVDLESFYFRLARQLLDSGQTFETTPGIQNIEVVIIQAFSQGRDGGSVQAALDWTLFLQRTVPCATVIEEAIRFARKHSDPQKLVECLYSLGETYRLNHEYEPAHETLTKAREKCEKLGDLLTEAKCLWSLGELCRMRRKWEEAEMNFMEARDLYETISEPYEATNCMWGLGEIWRMSGRHDDAEDVLNEARHHFICQGNLPGAVQCMLSLAEVWQTRGKYLDAEKVLEEARCHHASLADPLGMAECLWCLGEVRRKMAKYTEAQEVLSESRDIYNRLCNPTGEANCLLSLGEIERRTGHYDEAENKLTDAQGRYRSIEDLLGETTCIWSLGEVWRLRGKYREAEKVLSEARSRYKLLNNLFGVTNCLWSLGEVRRLEENYQEAESLLTDARKGFESFGDPYVLPDCLWSLGEVWRVTGKSNEAEKVFIEARDRYTSLCNLGGATKCLWSLGDIFRRIGDYDRAEEYLTTAQAEYISMGDCVGELNCLLSLREVACNRGKYDQAAE